MNSAEEIRNSIIDQLLTISNNEYLKAIFEIINSSKKKGEKIQPSDAQIAMLNMSEEDIKKNRLISQEDLDESDLKWLESQ
ncbi:hypothetical protein [Belliella pelovolcani]|uniref:Uncharacterized protein n=1 Tax=Belliella pelovolcani TaxID=529505 RepID=A0A1N7LDH2_9BACT|nr:hypothetical protein [Belliella pelovolcani]SIS71810.1 hypothetical protein SAMN05421761_103243 [Belliella pelovolcani]